MTVSVRIQHRFAGFALDAAFEIEAGGVTALFGPSGAGKSTIVAALAGLLRPQHGQIRLGAATLFDSQANIFEPPQRRRIGVVFQEARLFPHLSVEENLRYGWRRAPERASEAEIAGVIALLDLARLRRRRPAGLSGGEKSRVALGRALLSSPRLLLLDEPLAALDAARKAEILPYLMRLRDETKLPMLYVSHSLDEVTRLADRVVLIHHGKIAQQGSVFDLLGDLEFAAGLGQPAYGAAIEVSVAAQRADEGLTVLRFDGGELVVRHVALELGARLRVRIRAEDIMLALEEPRSISANNVLAARVSAIAVSGGDADVQLDCGGVKLIARITRASCERLKLMPGLTLYAVIKSVTVDPKILPAPER